MLPHAFNTDADYKQISSFWYGQFVLGVQRSSIYGSFSWQTGSFHASCWLGFHTYALFRVTRKGPSHIIIRKGPVAFGLSLRNAAGVCSSADSRSLWGRSVLFSSAMKLQERIHSVIDLITPALIRQGRIASFVSVFSVAPAESLTRPIRAQRFRAR